MESSAKALLGAGDVVKVTYADKGSGKQSIVLGVVESPQSSDGTVGVFVGSSQSWRVPVASVTRVGLPTPFSWTAADSHKVRAAAGDSPPPTASRASPSPSRQAAASPTVPAAPLKASMPADVVTPRAEALQPSPSMASLHGVSSASFRHLDSAAAEPSAPFPNVLYELNARLTGLCTWSCPALTATFLAVLFAWLAVEGTSLHGVGKDGPWLRASAVAPRCAMAVWRTVLTVVLCTCVSMAPRQTPTSTFWLVFPLIVVSLGGAVPVTWWNALVVGCFPVCMTPAAAAGDAAAAAASPEAVPLLFWLGSLLSGSVRAFRAAVKRS